MKPQSAKDKGRRLQQEIRAALLMFAPSLKEDDIISRSMGAGGEDLILSPAARLIYPISAECKYQENLNIWKAMEQTYANADVHHIPVLFFRRNRSETYAALPASTLLSLLVGRLL